MIVLKLVLLPTDHDLEAVSNIVQMSERKPQRIELRTSANRVVQVDCELPEYTIDPSKAPLERHETPSLDKITHRISQPGIVEVCPGARRKWCKLKYRVSSRSSQSSNQTEKPSEALRAFTLWRFPTLPGERGFSLEVTSTLIVYIGARRQQDSRKSWPFSERWIQERVNDNKVLKRKTPFYIRKQENAHNESVRDREKIRKQFERGQEKARKRGNDTVFQLDRRLRKGHIDQATFDKEVEKLDTTLGMSYHLYPVVPSSRNRDADACDGHNARPERPRLSSTESIRQSDRNLSQAPNIVREPDSGRHPRAHDSASSGSRRFETWLDSISSIDDHQGRHDKQEPQPNRPAEISHARTCPIEVPQNAGRKVVRLAGSVFRTSAERLGESSDSSTGSKAPPAVSLHSSYSSSSTIEYNFRRPYYNDTLASPNNSGTNADRLPPPARSSGNGSTHVPSKAVRILPPVEGMNRFKYRIHILPERDRAWLRRKLRL